MKITRRQFVKGGVAAFTVTFAAPAFLSDLARAQGAHAPQPGGAVSERRQRRPQHARCRTTTRSTTAGGRRLPCRRATCCRSGTDSSQRGARAASAADRPAADLQRRTPGAHSAHGYPNQSRSHFQGTDIWSTANPGELVGPRLARPLSRLAAVAARSADRLEHDARSAARAAGGPRVGAGDSERRRRTRSRARTPGAEAAAERDDARRGSARTCRSIGRSWRSCTAARRRRWHARSRGDGRHVQRHGHVSDNSGFAPGAEGRGRRDGPRASARRCSTSRRADSTRTRRRTSNAVNGAYFNLMAHAQRRPARVLQRPAEPGAARGHAAR